MKRHLLLFALVLFLATEVFGQEYRTYDGTYNNPYHPEWGSVDVQLLRLFPADYADGVSEPGGQNRPDARVISNALFAQDSDIWDILEQSDYCWVYGQFIDHNITLVLDNEEEPLAIPIPAGDPWFDPLFTGNQEMYLLRSVAYPGTGTSQSNPREHPNNITSFIDASAVYGSDSIRAAYLRSFQGGKLRMSSGNLLPWNTLNGEVDGTIDPNAPFMANPTGALKLFVAGDIRANENVLLLSMHTLFAREHNRLCDELALQHPEWNDEQLYQHARKIVGGLIQHIAFSEWLPTLGITLPPYTGYKPNVNPTISNIFAASAYRMGHSQLGGDIMMMDMNGDTMEVMPLKDAFFNPYPVYDYGIDYFLKGMAVHMEQMLDAKVVDDVRNFLFGEPGEGGLDLAALNITRGRERGIPDLNTIRLALGLTPYTEFSQINSDPGVYQVLEDLYGDINEIDSWVGFLCEEPMPNSILGETLTLILSEQFQRLRDGDRFYFENDPALTEEEKDMIRNTRMKDVIRRNTIIPVMQDNVFLAMPQDMLCTAGEPDAPVSGTTTAPSGVLVQNVQVDIFLDDSVTVLTTAYTDQNGAFVAEGVPTCDNYYVRPRKDDDVVNGVTTLDMVAISRHILGIDPLADPYKMVAADANRSNSITTLDLVAIQKVILQIEDHFPNNTSWRFVPADFIMPSDPFAQSFPEQVVIDNLLEAADVAFTAIKIGDVNDSATFHPDGGDLAFRNAALDLQLKDAVLEGGRVYEIPVYADAKNLSGMQWSLSFVPGLLDYVSVESGWMSGIEAADYNYRADRADLLFSWIAPEGVALREAEHVPAFYLRLQVQKRIRLSELMDVQSRVLPAEAYDAAADVYALHWQFEENGSGVYEMDGLSAQSSPNPFSEQTEIEVLLPGASFVHLMVYDALGRKVFEQREEHVQAHHTFTLHAGALGGAGSYRYVVLSDFGTVSKTLIVN